MQRINLIVLFACFSLLCYINPTNGGWFYFFPPKFHNQEFQPLRSAQANRHMGDFNELTLFPFASFPSLFRQRSVTPFMQISREVEKAGDNMTDSSFRNRKEETVNNNKREESKVDDSFHSKVVNVTGKITDTAETSTHRIQKKFMERVVQTSVFERLLDPLSRLRRYRLLRSRFSGNHNNYRMTEEEDKQQNNAGTNAPCAKNETNMMATRDSSFLTLQEKQNCICLVHMLIKWRLDRQQMILSITRLIVLVIMAILGMVCAVLLMYSVALDIATRISNVRRKKTGIEAVKLLTV